MLFGPEAAHDDPPLPIVVKIPLSSRYKSDVPLAHQRMPEGDSPADHRSPKRLLNSGRKLRLKR